jgi:hypothetical protein
MGAGERIVLGRTRVRVRLQPAVTSSSRYSDVGSRERGAVDRGDAAVRGDPGVHRRVPSHRRGSSHPLIDTETHTLGTRQRRKQVKRRCTVSSMTRAPCVGERIENNETQRREVISTRE